MDQEKETMSAKMGIRGTKVTAGQGEKRGGRRRGLIGAGLLKAENAAVLYMMIGGQVGAPEW